MVGDIRATVILLLIVFSLTVTLPSIAAVKATEDPWTTLEPMPTTESNLGVAVVNGKIYAIGGGVNYEYDPATDTWAYKTPMSLPRWDFGITVFQNKIYVIGGDLSKDGHPEANEVYDPATDSWTSGAPMPNFEGFAFADITSAVVDNKIYVFSSGEREHNGVFTQIYDPETDEWSSGAPIPIMIDYACAVSTSGIFAPKRIHVLGVDYDGHEGESGHQIYDPTEDMWTIGTALSAPRHGLGLATIDDLLYAIGGSYEYAIDGSYDYTTSDGTLRFTPIGYIPEFLSWVILPLFLSATLFALIIKKEACI
jgi:hypothetical protein